jgi:DNA-binding beta-propeller fold protein YncE
MMKRAVLISAFLIVLPRIVLAFTLSGFDTPDSVIIDSETGSYYVSNITGDRLAKDGNGYISKITPNGNTLIQKYIGGKPEKPILDAPKGLLLAGRYLYVADIDKLKVFDKQTTKHILTVDMEPYGASDLTDIAADATGQLYISDRSAGKIFSVNAPKNYEVSLFSQDVLLSEPNGLAVNPRTRNLMVVTRETGKILEIDSSRRAHILKKGLRQLDGIDFDIEGNLYVASSENGEIYKIPFYGRGALSTYISSLLGPTGISYDRKKYEIVVASARSSTVTTYPKIRNVIRRKSLVAKPESSPQSVVLTTPAK